MLESIVPFFLRHWPTALAIALVAFFARNYFNRGLNKYPGPFLAALTNWWRFFDVYGRRPDITHIALHRKYGDIVRLGPNVLSFADPKAIKVIYGLNKGFVKVGCSLPGTTCIQLTSHSPNSTPCNSQCRKASDFPHSSPQLTKSFMRTCVAR